MLAAINFDGDFWMEAGEIDNVAIDWNLTPKMETLFAEFTEM